MNFTAKITSIDQLPERYHSLAKKIGLEHALIAIAELNPRPEPKFFWVDEIKDLEHFPKGAFQDMADLVGVEDTIRLMQRFEGETIYFRRIREAFIDVWHPLLHAEYKRHNIAELAHKYEVAVPTVRQIVNDQDDERQVDLFPEEDFHEKPRH